MNFMEMTIKTSPAAVHSPQNPVVFYLVELQMHRLFKDLWLTVVNIELLYVSMSCVMTGAIWEVKAFYHKFEKENCGHKNNIWKIKLVIYLCAGAAQTFISHSKANDAFS